MRGISLLFSIRIKMKLLYLLLILNFCLTSKICAENIADYSWHKVALGMPSEWYDSEEAIMIADRVLEFQMHNGGWPKNVEFHKEKNAGEKLKHLDKSGIGATIDNGATVVEMRFLAKVYQCTREQKYKDGFIKGVNYLLEAQYENGGWPQFYPVRKGRSVAYSACITFNDNAYINVMKLLKDLCEDSCSFDGLDLSNVLQQQVRVAFDKGVQCILNTQIRVNGVPTVWCAQHDQYTLKPAQARAYELASYSGSESAEIVLFLMSLSNPSNEIVSSVEGAVKWFENHKIPDMKYERYRDENGNKEARLIPAKGEVVWARFYDLETGRPFFCDRDGIKRSSIDLLGKERRGGYVWYVSSPKRVLENYSKWIEINGLD